ncbi:MAG: uracil-DNA glycosylase [Hyphomicrobiales bacterium]|nr:uracil-DNA glycosylase [Hyphomicrobiales bacterium]
MAPARPGRNCPRCPRLVAFREHWRAREAGWFNAPVPPFGHREARLAIIGLAPGLRGANRTGRPFTGDFAGGLLYDTLRDYGFARGQYAARPDDGLELIDCRIVNAVRCVPPENKPTPAEIANCRTFLKQDLADMPKLAAIVALGRIAHDSIVVTLGGRPAGTPFGHGQVHQVGNVTVFDSYHCSRQNTNTRRLTPEMFGAVFAQVRAFLDG